MSAERLREAAALMREQVALAPEQTKVGVRIEGVWLNSRHYMPVDSTFLLAVADWLDRVADDEPSWSYAHAATEAESALAVANAYLGDPS